VTLPIQRPLEVRLFESTLVALFLTSCGRIGYDPLALPSEGGLAVPSDADFASADRGGPTTDGSATDATALDDATVSVATTSDSGSGGTPGADSAPASGSSSGVSAEAGSDAPSNGDSPAGAGSSSGASAEAGSDASNDAGACPSGPSGSGSPTIGGIFEQPEPWTQDVSALPKYACSDAMMTAFGSLGGWGGGRLQINFSIPLFFAGASTPRQTVTAPAGVPYCFGGPDCDPVPLQVPIPVGGNAEGSANYACNTSSGDCRVLVVETSQKRLYELYNATSTGSSFTALGAFVWDLTKAYPENLRGDQCTSADAAGFPVAGLLPTADEVAAGAVNHALRLLLPAATLQKAVYVHPATHAGASTVTVAGAPPFGAHLRLNSTFDASAYSTGEKVILQAMKRYGLLVASAGTIGLTFADDRTATAKWASLGVTALSFAAIPVSDFEIVDFSPEIPFTASCVRNP
jgi:hypothetical protein